MTPLLLSEVSGAFVFGQTRSDVVGKLSVSWPPVAMFLPPRRYRAGMAQVQTPPAAHAMPLLSAKALK